MTVEFIERDGVTGVDCDGRFIPAISGGTGVEIAGLAIAAIGAAVGAYSAYSSAQDQKQALKAQSRMRNSEAAMAQAAGVAAAARQRKKDSYALGRFASSAAVAGILPRAGSALLAELDYATQAELEAQSIQQGYEVTAATKRTEANFAKWQADRINPTTAAGLSLFSSTASIASGYMTGGGAGAQMGGGLSRVSRGSSPSASQIYSH